MATYGYIFVTSHKEWDIDKQKESMQALDCDKIIEEPSSQEKLRPEWRRMLSNLKKHDTIIVYKLSHAVRGIRELGVFLDLVSNYDIRLISIMDHIDTANEVYNDTTAGDVLKVVGSLSAEIAALRKQEIKAQKKVRSIKNPRSLKTQLKVDREKTVVNMYNSGHSIEDIWEASGYKSRTSVFRVLNRYGVQLNRGRHQGKSKRTSFSNI